MGHHCVSPGPAPSSIPPAASTPHHPEPWSQGISGASASREDPGVPGPFVGGRMRTESHGEELSPPAQVSSRTQI